MHDLAIYKKTLETYKNLISCGILGDCAYYTKEANRPDNLLIGIKPESRDKDLIHKRIPIEWYFGKLKKLWRRMTHRYVRDHSRFSDEFAICVYLTNEVIEKYEEPSSYDGEFNERVERKEEAEMLLKATQRREYMAKYSAKVKERLGK